MEGEDLAERMGGRFPGEESDEDAESEVSEEHANSDKATNRGEDADSDAGAWSVDNIRQSDKWRVMQLHLPDAELGEDFDEAWYDFQAATKGEYPKDRYFKPLLVTLGLEALEDLDRKELTACLERLEQSGGE